MRLRLSEPNVLRIPTSFALLSDRAVDRFIKLTQAISRMIIPMMENKRTYSIMPPVFFPFLKSLYNLHLYIGKVK